MLLPPRGKGLSEEEAKTAIEWYRMFLFLKLHYPHEALVPFAIVDEVWKSHILETRRYTADCEMIADSLLHYDPAFGINDSRRRAEAFRRIRELYRTEFGAVWQYEHLLSPEEKAW